MNPFSWAAQRFLKRPVKVRVVTDEDKVARYVKAGTEFGDAVSEIYLGERVGFEDLLIAYEDAEADYSALGYRTLPIDDFVEAGGWGKELVGLREPRVEGEVPVHHAIYYRVNFLGKVYAAIDLARMMRDGQVQVGDYTIPSTAHLVRKR